MATRAETLIHELNIEVALLKVRIEDLRTEVKPLAEQTIKIAIMQSRLDELTKSYAT